MAEIEEALKTYLLTKANLTALISGRIYCDNEIPEKPTKPYIFYMYVSDIIGHTHDGQLSLRSPRIQYSACADTRAAAIAVANQIEAALNDYSGVLSGITVQKTMLQDIDKSTESNPEGTVKIHFADLEYEVNYIKS